MKNTIKTFGSESKMYLKVYWTTIQAIAFFVLVYTIGSYVSGKQITIIESGDAVLKTGIVEVQAKK